VKSDLESGKKVLFIGCPCQIRRLKEFLNKDYENLLLVDLFCYGYSEPKVLENFVDEVEKESGSQVVSLDMRKNHKYICSVKFMDGSGREYNNVFSKFINKENLMPMCKECNMHKGSNVSDITVGDFWGFKQGNMPDVFSPKNGTNIVVLNTQQGAKMFNSISSELEVLKV
jgi:coenzyme F420-reducing hydrogenase beta subunit